MKRVFIAFVVLVCLSPSISAHAPAHHRFQLVAFTRPVPAPTFSLTDLSQHRQVLTDFKGRYVLLNFWATWCVPCVQEMPSLEKLHQKFRSSRFVVVAIATDTAGLEVVEPFARKFELTFPILLDSDQTVSSQYGVRDLPASFLLDPQGRVIAAAKGERDWFSEQALSYMQEVLNVAPLTQP